MTSTRSTSTRSSSSNSTVVQGVRLDNVSLEDTMSRIETACEERRAMQVVTVNMNFVTLARHHPSFRNALRSAELAVTDGRLLYWSTHLLGGPVAEQITGHDLMAHALQLANRRGYRMYLLGGAAGIAQELAAQLEETWPNLTVRGTDGGRFDAEGNTPNQAKLMAEIQAFDPHLLFVGLGAPKQDLWLHRHLRETQAVGVGVGGVFDTLMGKLPRAPRWMQVIGLESAFRLAVDPQRYWKRYLVEDPPTLLRIGAQIGAHRLRR